MTASRVSTPWRSSSASASACSRRVRSRSIDRSPGAHRSASARTAKAEPAGWTSDQRPAASGGPERGEPARPRPPVPARALPAQGAQGRERVVRDLAGPDQVPQCVEHVPVRAAACRRVELAVEGGAPCRRGTRGSRHGEAAGRGRPRRRAGPRRATERPASRPAGTARSRPSSRPRLPRRHPGDLAERPELIEEPRLVAGDARRQHIALQRPMPASGRPRAGPPPRRGVRARPGLGSGPAARSEAGTHDALPGRQEPRERRALDGFHLAPQAGQRPAPEGAKHFGIAPLALRAAGPELAEEKRPAMPPAARARQRRSRAPAAPTARPARPSRNGPWVRAQRASRPPSGSRDSPRNAIGVPGGGWAPVRIAVAAGVLHRDPAGCSPPIRTTVARRVASSTSSHSRATARPPRVRSATSSSARSPRRRSRSATWSDGTRLAVGTAPAGSAPSRRARPGRAARAAPPGREARGGGRGRARAPARDAPRGAHRPRTCRRRRSRTAASTPTGSPRGLHRVDGDLAPGDAAEHVAEGGQVEDVRQAFAVRLDEDREAPVPAGDAEQVGGALALLPERRPRAGPAARQQQRARRRSRGSARRRGPSRRPRQPRGPRRRPGRGRARPRPPRGRPRAGGSRSRRPTRWTATSCAEPLAKTALDRQRPGRVDAPAERA